MAFWAHLPGPCYLSYHMSSDCHLPSFCGSHTRWSWCRKAFELLLRLPVVPSFPTPILCASLTFQRYSKLMLLSQPSYLKLQHSWCHITALISFFSPYPTCYKFYLFLSGTVLPSLQFSLCVVSVIRGQLPSENMKWKIPDKQSISFKWRSALSSIIKFCTIPLCPARDANLLFV